MNEYVCHYLLAPGRTARRVYHADTLPAVMAAHNAAMPECRDKVLKWTEPASATYDNPRGTVCLPHDASLTMDAVRQDI